MVVEEEKFVCVYEIYVLLQDLLLEIVMCVIFWKNYCKVFLIGIILNYIKIDVKKQICIFFCWQLFMFI